MTLFEYLAVAISIILGFSFTHLLGGLRGVLERGRRYPVHYGYFFFLLILHPQLWWALWDLHDRPPLNLLSFIYTLLGPALLYLTGTFLVPVDRTFRGRWEEHFNASRRWVYGFTAAYALWGVGEVYWVFDVSLWHPYRLVQLSLLVVSLSGVAIPSARLDRIAVPLLWAIIIGGQLIFRLYPGGYVNS